MCEKELCVYNKSSPLGHEKPLLANPNNNIPTPTPTPLHPSLLFNPSMLRSCYRPLERCLGGRNSDGLLWHMDLNPHASGDFSIAVVQANSSLEDQSAVFTSPSATYIGVYDGHGGPEASRFVNQRLFPYLNKFSTEYGGLSVDVIKKAFSATEEDFTSLARGSLPFKPKIATVGSCCLVGAISNDELYVANLGDSRAVLGRKGMDSVVAERLSTDHNVSCEDVRKEVQALHPDDLSIVVHRRGAWRVKGIIQVSRSIGDLYLKKPEFNRDPLLQQLINPVTMKRPALSAEPSIVTRKIKPQDLFLIFASDGLWEHLSDEEAVKIVFKSSRPGIAKKLVGAAIQAAAKKREMRYKDIREIKKGSRRHFHDDISVIVIYLDHHKVSFRKGNQSKFGCISAPVDIFSYQGFSDEDVKKATALLLDESRNNHGT